MLSYSQQLDNNCKLITINHQKAIKILTSLIQASDKLKKNPTNNPHYLHNFQKCTPLSNPDQQNLSQLIIALQQNLYLIEKYKNYILNNQQQQIFYQKINIQNIQYIFRIKQLYKYVRQQINNQSTTFLTLKTLMYSYSHTGNTVENQTTINYFLLPNESLKYKKALNFLNI